MKKRTNILMAFLAIVLMAVCLADCARRPEAERYATGQDIVTQERPIGKWTDCRVCKGKGTCIECKGTGKVNGKECNACKGSGRCTTCEGQGGFRSEE